MDRPTIKEHTETVAIIQAETDYFPSKAAARRWLDSVISRALQLHTLYEGECCTDLGPAGNATRASRIRSIERGLRHDFAVAGLALYLNGDPRGNPVGIHTPKSGRFNTMGGAECGWRL